MEEDHGWDFLELLGPDISFGVFSYLHDPADLVRTAAVSRSWRQFVIANGFSKRLCIKLCPEVAYFTGIKEVVPADMMQQDESSSMSEFRIHERDHRIYTYLNQKLVSTRGTKSCISHSIGASSTDNFPEESIENTLEPCEHSNSMPSYWSSGGEVDPAVPESLMYRLSSDLTLVDEIRIRPFRAFFQNGYPIYSSKYVRFKLGCSKLPITPAIFELQQSHLIADENYVWTYTSPQYPMQQENVLQSFKLPRPVLCIGGVVKVELLDRVQKQALDDLFYICICHVQVRGRKLSPILEVDSSGIASGRNGVVLKFYPMAWMNRLSVKGVRSHRDARKQSPLQQPLEWPAVFDRFRKSRRS